MTTVTQKVFLFFGRVSAGTKADIQALSSKLEDELVVREALIILQELSVKTDLSYYNLTTRVKSQKFS